MMLTKKKQRRSTFLHRLICFVMGLHIINLSIDAPDQYAPVQLVSSQSENLAINDIESFTELLLEQGLGIDDAVPEQDEPDEESNLLKLKQDYVFTNSFVFAPLLPLIRFVLHTFILSKLIRIPVLVADVISPPPQLVKGLYNAVQQPD